MATVDEKTPNGTSSNTPEQSGGILSRVRGALDNVVSPEKRAQWWEKVQSFATANPKVAAFLLANLALSGPAIVVFILFTLSVLIFTLVASLVIALLTTVLFTVAAVVFALFILLPTIFITTFVANFIFIWGLGGYYILKWFNDGGSVSEAGTRVIDIVNGVTGGRLSGLADTAKSTLGLPKTEELSNATSSLKSAPSNVSEATSKTKAPSTASDAKPKTKAPAVKKPETDGAGYEHIPGLDGKKE